MLTIILMKKKTFLLFVLLHIGKLLQDETRGKYAEIGLSHGHARILRALFRFGRLNQAKISQALYIKPSTVSRMIKDMEARGLVERRPDVRDVRVIRVSLTARGEKAALLVRDICERTEEKLLKGLDKRDIKYLRARFDKIREGLGGKPPDFNILRDETKNEARIV
ncbi:MAG: MarR family transcriptional regulator [Candidatus Omnitrophota bacterium]